MNTSRPITLDELLAQLIRLRATHGDRGVWIDRETRSWVARVVADDDGDVTLHGNEPVEDR